MRMQLVAGLALSAVFVLSGCVAPQSIVMPTSAQTSTPVFASDEEALAAATAAYTEYLRVEDLIAQDGGATPERMKDLVTPEWLNHETATFGDFAKTGHKQVGSSVLKNFTLQSYEDSGKAGGQISAYVCVDFSGTSFVDAGGADVTPAGRPTNGSLEVVLSTGTSRPATFRISGSEQWPGPSVC